MYKMNTLIGYKLLGQDGEFGKIKEFLFDDQHWAVRYLVADTGSWLEDRQVLISPYVLKSIDAPNKQIHIELTRAQIEASPPLSTDLPVSKQYQEAYYSYYGLPLYWGGPYMWGASMDIIKDREIWNINAPTENAWDPHLRSSHDMSGHKILALDGEIGHAADFILDDSSWAIRYLEIATSNWPVAKHVLISPRWIERISWKDMSVTVSLLRDTIKNSPIYNPNVLLTRDYESDLHHHYKRDVYWAETLAKIEGLKS